MNDVVVSVENMAKKFSKSLKRAMYYGTVDVLRDILEISSDPKELRPAEFYALKNISFEIKKGESLALIGRNGTGKSTLLKVLNGIYRPDLGSVKIWGKVRAMIEVGAGFHPMLTGRENIYINGSILGMSKREVDKKFDSIVDFSGVEDFIDTPVKFYSSGMYVRLGFAVAAHLEPDVLLVDEVLAVGDMAFQAKCLEFVSNLCREGCTIIFVSHNEELVRRACNRGIFINDAQIVKMGSLDECYREYHKTAQGWITDVSRSGNKKVEITDVKFYDENDIEQNEFLMGKSMTMKVYLNPHQEVNEPALQIAFNSNLGYVAANTDSHFMNINLGVMNEPSVIVIYYPSINLTPGGYRITAIISASDRLEIFDWRRNGWDFMVV
ncbi:MAG: ABC transporter ATP-binding protein, partial [Chlamydiota bacterium]|nr:ABC transporter ATP-binding protein [Chlamydiota bacterium]